MSARAAGRPSYFRDVTERFTGLELFFDLLFAFCVSQLTRVYRDQPTWGTAATAVGSCAYLLAMNAMTRVLRVPGPESLS
jgi:low temperature requirement protein LtrA